MKRALSSVLIFLALASLPAAAIAQERNASTPAIARGGDYMGFPERFNRYYTDPAWKPSRVVFASPTGSGNGASRDAPMSAQAAIANARPGTLITIVRGRYQACFEFSKTNSGSYNEPVVIQAERNPDRTPGVQLTCCSTGRQSCFNFENADYVAVDGFELIGGRYGVRAVGEDYTASKHARGIAVVNTIGHDQTHDPFFTGQVDWAVFERNLAYGAQKGDGHGIYISNGGDWNIVRFNETHSNVSTGIQINADPQSTCKEVGIAFSDPRCHAYAGTGDGGQGASDYFLIDSNYFHRSDVGANFTSLRRSVVRNNIFGPATRHNVSFWQETDEPQLGSRENVIVHNLFVTTGRHAVQFVANSTRNAFANNVILGVRISGGAVSANPAAMLMEVDNSVGANEYRSNLYVSGRVEGRTPAAGEVARPDFSPGWYALFPTAPDRGPDGFSPTGSAPFLNGGAFSPYAPVDRRGTPRPDRVDLGPVEIR
jgi:hypothetical protein